MKMKFRKARIKRCEFNSLILFMLILMITSFSVDNWRYKDDLRNNRVKIHSKITNHPNDEISQKVNTGSVLRSSLNSLQYKRQYPFQIDGNNDFLIQAAERKWPGDGSEGNPIVLDGLSITGRRSVDISNTDLYFHLSNCMVKSGEEQNTVPTLIFNNIRNGYISNNILVGGGESVLQISSSDHITISDNLITNAGYPPSILGNGLELLQCSNINVTSNIVSNNSFVGIILTLGSSNNIISGNTIQNNGDIGIELEYDQNSNNKIFDNTVLNNADVGILLSETSNDNDVKRNDFIDNNVGGISQGSDDGSNNMFAFNHWDDWISPDTNVDGIVDDPYSIEGTSNNKDDFPYVIQLSLMNHSYQYYFLESWDTGFGQDDVILRITSNAIGHLELTLTFTLGSPSQDKTTLRIKLYNLMSTLIHYVEIPLGIKDKPTGVTEYSTPFPRCDIVTI